MRFGFSLPSQTFMPEQKTKEVVSDPCENLLYGYEQAMRIGYDYIEAAVGAVNSLSEEQLLKLSQMHKKGEFSIEYCNCFIPLSLPVCTADMAQLRDFVDSSMKRMAQLGVRKVVFGSGAARSHPDTMTKEDGMSRIKEFLSVCGDVGKRYNIMTVVEPLNSTETNMITSVSEGAQVVRELSLEKIQLLADAFHMSMEKEDVTVVAKNIDILSHFHVSEAPGRVCPGKHSGEYIKSFFSMIKENDIQGDMTVECVFDDFQSALTDSLKFLKESV